MCGIITLFKESNSLDLVSLWDRLSHRGEDSYGIIKYNGNIKTNKSLSPNGFDKISNYNWLIAHNRKASIGHINLQLAHPVAIQNKVFIIHNGTNRSLYAAHKKALSDTHAIGLIYNDLKNKEKIYDYLEDTGVVWIIDTELKLIFFHKDSGRSLFVDIENKYIASEPISAGKWRKVNETDYIWEFKEFNFKNFKNDANIAKKILEITSLKEGFCDICYKPKWIMEKSKKINRWSAKASEICPVCEYENKKREVSIGFTENIYRDYYNRNGGWR